MRIRLSKDFPKVVRTKHLSIVGIFLKNHMSHPSLILPKTVFCRFSANSHKWSSIFLKLFPAPARTRFRCRRPPRCQCCPQWRAPACQGTRRCRWSWGPGKNKYVTRTKNYNYCNYIDLWNKNSSIYVNIACFQMDYSLEEPELSREKRNNIKCTAFKNV